MRVLIQRVSQATVSVQGNCVGKIDRGLLVFIGMHRDDDSEKVDWMVDKIITLRIFPDTKDRMHFNVKDINAGILVVSQFTLYGNCLKGRRPDFLEAAQPDLARNLYEQFITKLKQKHQQIETGQFQADMDVFLVNDGPVTLLLER